MTSRSSSSSVSHRVLVVMASAVALVSVACGGDHGERSDGDAITVFAASSLTEAYTEIGEAFTAATGHVATFNFAGSGDLVAQIGEGAPADVFTSADESNMGKLVEAGDAGGDPVLIAANSMEIIVETGNPLGIDDVADLAAPDTVVVLCADTVPCGKGAAAVLDAAGVTVAPVSLEDKVKGVVTKVTTGEADAGIVFVTDVLAAGDSAEGVEIPADINTISKYPIVVVKDSENAAAAQAFVDFVASDAGQEILASYGFQPA